jgi:hypothetical protein
MKRRKVQQVEDGIDTLLRVSIVMARHDDRRVREMATIVEAVARGLLHEHIADALTRGGGVAELSRRILAEHEREHGMLSEGGEGGVALLHAPPRDTRKSAAVALREQVRRAREEMADRAPHGAVVESLTDLVLTCLQSDVYSTLRQSTMPAVNAKEYVDLRGAVVKAVDKALMSGVHTIDESVVRCALRAAGLPDRTVRNLFRV